MKTALFDLIVGCPVCYMRSVVFRTYFVLLVSIVFVPQTNLKAQVQIGDDINLEMASFENISLSYDGKYLAVGGLIIPMPQLLIPVRWRYL